MSVRDMVNKSSATRKTFFAREDLLGRLSEVAKDRGCSLYELVNEIFELAIASDNLGLSLERVVEARGKLESAQGAGFVLGLERLWYEMADLAYEKGQRKALKSWFDAGVWFAKYYITGAVANPIAAFARDLTSFTWNAPEFTINQDGGKVTVSITSPRFTNPYTILFTSFLEGAIETFGYKVGEKYVSRGVIRIEASKEGRNASA